MLVQLNEKIILCTDFIYLRTLRRKEGGTFDNITMRQNSEIALHSSICTFTIYFPIEYTVLSLKLYLEICFSHVCKYYLKYVYNYNFYTPYKEVLKSL